MACAFNANHTMGLPKYVWHLARCPDKKKREAAKLPIYYCQNNRLHIFLNLHDFKSHQKNCLSSKARLAEETAQTQQPRSREQKADLKAREALSSVTITIDTGSGAGQMLQAFGSEADEGLKENTAPVSGQKRVFAQQADD